MIHQHRNKIKDLAIQFEIDSVDNLIMIVTCNMSQLISNQ